MKKEKSLVNKKLIKLCDVKFKRQKDIEFYPRVINETNITFSNDELTVLSKSLKYYGIKTLALEAEAAFCQLPSSEQNYTRYLVTSNINWL